MQFSFCRFQWAQSPRPIKDLTTGYLQPWALPWGLGVRSALPCGSETFSARLVAQLWAHGAESDLGHRNLMVCIAEGQVHQGPAMGELEATWGGDTWARLKEGQAPGWGRLGCLDQAFVCKQPLGSCSNWLLSNSGFGSHQGSRGGQAANSVLLGAHGASHQGLANDCGMGWGDG